MDPAMEAARKAMIAKRFGGNVNGASTGGSGSARRKKKGAARPGLGDDKKLGTVLKKMNLNEIKGIEEVNFFKDDGSVIHVTHPKIQASVPSNTFVISGHSQEKRLEEMLPGVLSQLGPESMEYLRTYAEKLKAAGAAAGAGMMPPVAEGGEEEEDDDEVPDLVENFEEAANK
mmetsp:Transcript_113465/g.321084  ORF Transcript_113465/g.321084 Transcript_113465/m.321084 type:complete len:173 (-) Transcript_113465:159-677(-)